MFATKRPEHSALRPRSLFILLGIVSLNFWGCSSQPASAQPESVSIVQSKIMGGEDDPNDPAVVGIFIEMGYNAGLCTGSLIAPNLVLTARHCVAETGEAVQCGASHFGSEFATSSFHVTTEWDGLEKAIYSYDFSGNWFDVAKVWVSDEDSVCGNDVALIELAGDGVDSSIAQPLVPRLDSRMSPGERYTAVGYGSTNDYGQGAGRKRVLSDLSAHCVGNCNPFYLDNEFEWQGERGICQGDSGGPALDDQNRVVGVVSRGGAGCTTPIYADLVAWADWIREKAKIAAKDGNYPPADWTTAPVAQGGAAGAAGTSGQGGSAGADNEATGGPGASCSGPEDCSSPLLCVQENSMVRYCAPACSEQNPDCPQGWTCSTTAGACFQDGAFGSPCERGEDCRSGICVADARGRYCSSGCSTESPDCPEPATCDQTQGACFLPPPDEEDAQGSSSVCSVSSPGKPPSNPVPWLAIAAWGLGVSWLRRRRSKRES